mmetsp:Transcript_63342/g.182251  ORF Transcript_63342/g.182251 Transcript_63342/m.182251 type:complete len:589 (-) Transcript_63342:28-1794(-)
MLKNDPLNRSIPSTKCGLVGIPRERFPSILIQIYHSFGTTVTRSLRFPMMSLSGMELQVSSRLDDAESVSESTGHGSEPESEIHISGEQQELQESLSNISSLGDLFMMQSQTLALMQPEKRLEDHGSDFSSSIASGTSCSENNDITMATTRSFEETLDEATEMLHESYVHHTKKVSPTSVMDGTLLDPLSLHGVGRILKFRDIEDYSSSHMSCSVDGSDSEIQAAIDEIRKEASQIDIIMALDQLKTVEADLEITSRALRDRSAEAEDLKVQLKEKDERISCLELEKDLYKADAMKLKDDLKTCVDRMFDISAVAGLSSLSDAPSPFPPEEKLPPDPLRDTLLRTQAQERPGSSLPDQGDNAPGPVKRVRGTPIRRPPSNSDPAGTIKVERAGTHSTRETFPLLRSSYSSDIFRGTPEGGKRARSRTVRSSTGLPPAAPLPLSRRRRSFSEVIRSSTALEHDTESEKRRMCGIFRRRPHQRSTSKGQEVAAMREKIDELHAMMKTSLETSEKLRKRLAMISRYYEGIIKKMQRQIVEAKTERTRIKSDADAKVSTMDHEKRTAIMCMEDRLRCQEEEIRLLKQQVQGL